MKHERENQAEQVAGGVFMIGLGLLFFTGFWWPGIMFVIGASMLARTIVEGDPIASNTGALITIGIGIIFGFPSLLPGMNRGNIWPLLLIGIGLFMLFGGKYRPTLTDHERKRKNDDLDDSDF